jgi:hypothetical protein
VTFHSGEKESRSVSRSRDNRRQNFVRKVLRNVPTRVLPCLWPISPSWLRWRLSRPALLMLLSVVPANDSILPTKWQPCAATQIEVGGSNLLLG